MLTTFVSYWFFKLLLVWVFTVNTCSEMSWLVTSLLPFLSLNKHDTKPLIIEKKKKKKMKQTNKFFSLRRNFNFVLFCYFCLFVFFEILICVSLVLDHLRGILHFQVAFLVTQSQVTLWFPTQSYVDIFDAWSENKTAAISFDWHCI